MSVDKDDLNLATGHLNARIDRVIDQTNSSLKDLAGKLTAVAEHSATTEARIAKIAPELGAIVNAGTGQLASLVERTLGMSELYGEQQYRAILDRLQLLEQAGEATLKIRAAVGDETVEYMTQRMDRLDEAVRYATEQLRARHVKFNALVARVAELEAMRAEIEDERAAIKGEPAARYGAPNRPEDNASVDLGLATSGRRLPEPITENGRVKDGILRNTLPVGYTIDVRWGDKDDSFRWIKDSSFRWIRPELRGVRPSAAGPWLPTYSAAVDHAIAHHMLGQIPTSDEVMASRAPDAAIMTAPDDDMGYSNVTDAYGRPFHVALTVADLNEAIGLLDRAQLYLPACDTKREIQAWLRKHDPKSEE